MGKSNISHYFPDLSTKFMTLIRSPVLSGRGRLLQVKVRMSLLPISYLSGVLIKS
jgi:hypothetical protein